ncbi:MAG: toll/interleukin-1 receptor domain-containing protein [Rhodocyclaceae bacterium]|nr:toll/interleukin-1 receptor domain-containing protein [Rhodocyclaceae bacterium]
MSANDAAGAVFISYSHADELWKDRIRECLLKATPGESPQIDVWDDRDIGGGEQWYDAILDAMDRARLALLLLSEDFLNSAFARGEEVPFLLNARGQKRMPVIPILLHPCAWEKKRWLRELQLLPRDNKPLSRMPRERCDAEIARIVDYVAGLLSGTVAPSHLAAAPKWATPDEVDIDRLPVTGAELFGRDAELDWLDDCWEQESHNVVSLVACGGAGKSTLVRSWVESLERDHYRGARKVFAWSFYSQGSGKRVTSSDLFIETALRFFGDPDPAKGTAWARGERLAGLLREERTLLLLDGLEPLQSPIESGRIMDPALTTLVQELAQENPGLCVMTSRESVAELRDHPGATAERNLEELSAESARALLRIARVSGSNAELEAAAAMFGNHALAVSLLARFLRDVPGHPASAAADIPELAIADEVGRHPRRLMAAFAARFGDGPELALLRVLGLFDRPAEWSAVAAVCAAPAIPGLTESLVPSAESNWPALLARLRACGLLAPEAVHLPAALDTHPLVREHFGEEFETRFAGAWREAHGRLFDHYRQLPDKEYPDTLQEMIPLYRAVAHGCKAGRHQQAYSDVHFRRIRRGNEYFSVDSLGAWGEQLASLSHFFERAWDQPVASLSEADATVLLDEAANALRATGRLRAAVQPCEASVERFAQKGRRDFALISAGNLRGLLTVLGELGQAREICARMAELAAKSNDPDARADALTNLAEVQHLCGEADRARANYEAAEADRRRREPRIPILTAFPGYAFCELVLDLGDHQQGLARAKQMLELASAPWIVRVSVFDLALTHLACARALLQTMRALTTRDLADETAHHLQVAVDGLRQAGKLDDIPRGLLVRAAFHAYMGASEKARRDLDETLTIAGRLGARLYEVDARLEYARLYLAGGETARALDTLARARGSLEKLGYHRRDADVAELVQALD